jgi:hypothetical protein
MTPQLEFTIRLSTGKIIILPAKDYAEAHALMHKAGHARGSYDIRGWARIGIVE